MLNISLSINVENRM